MSLKRIYHPWHKWECYPAGFYSMRECERGKEMYAEFLADRGLFQDWINKVFSKWLHSCEHFLTNENINRIAWIGQSAMCIQTGVPSKYRGGFFLLTKQQQSEANMIAAINLKRWLYENTKNRSVHRTMEDNGLFG